MFKKCPILLSIFLICLTFFVFFALYFLEKGDTTVIRTNEDLLVGEKWESDNVIKFSFPCDQPHEFEKLANGQEIDWGSKECRYIELTGFNVFKKEMGVECGFRSDGVVVWRESKK